MRVHRPYFCTKQQKKTLKKPITFLLTFGSLNSVVFCPLKAGYLIKACMHGWGRQGERKGEFEPLFCRRRRGKGDILRSNCHFSHFFLLFFFLFPPLLASFLLQAPAPSNRTERYEVPVRGRPHPSQLGRVAFDRGQSHHQRFQYDRES